MAGPNDDATPVGDVTSPASAALLGEAVWPDIDRPLLAIPIGSCEQHGPHLPFDTDTRIALAVADGLAAARSDVMISPPIAISASGEHAGFPGTLSIGTEVLEAVLVELVRSADWSSGVVLINGHGGNSVAVDAAVKQLRFEGRDVLAWWPRLGDGDTHAGRTETSLMLAIAPDLVRLDRVERGETQSIAALFPRLRAEGVRSVAPNGVLGDPHGATGAQGRQLLDALVADVVDRVRVWTSGTSGRSNGSNGTSGTSGTEGSIGTTGPAGTIGPQR